MTRKRIKRIHVNQHVIRSNAKHGKAEPAITVKVGRENFYTMEAEIRGPSTLKYSPHEPLLKCGARMVLQTTAPVVIDGNVEIT